MGHTRGINKVGIQTIAELGDSRGNLVKVNLFMRKKGSMNGEKGRLVNLQSIREGMHKIIEYRVCSEVYLQIRVFHLKSSESDAVHKRERGDGCQKERWIKRGEHRPFIQDRARKQVYESWFTSLDDKHGYGEVWVSESRGIVVVGFAFLG